MSKSLYLMENSAALLGYALGNYLALVAGHLARMAVGK